MAVSEPNVPNFVKCRKYPHKVLPDGVHVCDDATFEDRFVSAFPESSTRSLIRDGFFRLRREAVSLGLNGRQWVDGSFVEENPNPKDVDVVTFIDYERLNAVSPQAQVFAKGILDGRERTKQEHLIPVIEEAVLETEKNLPRAVASQANENLSRYSE